MASTADPAFDGLDSVELAAVKATVKENPELLQLPAEQQRQALDEIIGFVRDQRVAARSLIQELEKSRDKIIASRAEVEQRWVDDINQYEGESQLPTSKEYSTEGNNRERDTQPKVNLTRARTNMASARIADMLFPANDRNWDLQPLTDRIGQAVRGAAQQQQPVPQPGMPGQPPQAAPGGDPNAMPVPGSPGQDPSVVAAGAATADSDKAKCDGMREKIQNHLDDSLYSEHGRRVIEDGCKIGVGVMKGPFTRLVRRKRFGFSRNSAGKMVALLDVTEQRVPQCARVDPRFFYPAAARTMEECEQVFELHLMSRAAIKELAGQDGIDKPAAELLLKQAPDLGKVGDNLRKWNQRCVLKEEIEGLYAVWEAHVILNKEQLDALGLADLHDDVNAIPVAELWFSQGELLRASLSVLEADRRPPYWTWCYERADDTVYGYGIPWLYRNPQRSIDSIWLMLMHNLAVSSGPQVFYKKGIVRPKDGVYKIRGPKLWEVESEDVEDVSKVFRAETIPNNAPQLMEVLDLAIKLGDDEISLPSIAQGQPNEAVPTAAGLIQLLNASNIVQRRCAKSMDDDVISPMIERFYVWEMLHGTDDSIKGDFAVSARGTSVLLHKDIKAQHLQIIAQITADPRFAVYLKEGEFLREMFEAADVSSEVLLRTDEEADQIRQQQAQAAQQGAGAADQAKVQALQAQTDLKRQQLELQQQQWQIEQQQAAEQRAMLHQERMAELQDKADERRARLMLKQMELQIMAAQLATNKDISLAEIEKDLQIAQTSNNLQQFLGTMNARLKAATIAKDQQEMSLKVDPANVSGTGI
ncbi:MAG: hypothetical protein GAK28_00624 [Luteibacter sp.]|uniref:hypothetical protein n=1 Tax=Luteibacter sp. TaxID=1886636 RepID=UPI0013855B7B|nr:hypothetical protein [Luteibacter sp.]KAF1008992.1 MAG: hypothetical protein GAK28_00624 [Luteibacter sp.]